MENNKFEIIKGYIEENPLKLYDLKFSLLTSEEITQLAIKAIEINPYNSDIINCLHKLPIEENQLHTLYDTIFKIMELQKGVPYDISIYIKQYMNKLNPNFQYSDITMDDANDSSKRYICFGASEYRGEFKTIRNRDKSDDLKPIGGLWAAVYHKNEQYRSQWECFVVQEMSNAINSLQSGIIFSIAPNARQLVVNSKEDVQNLLEKYPYEQAKRGINWVKIAREYDVVVFTETGKDAIDYFDYEQGVNGAHLDIPSIVISNMDVVIDVEEYYDYDRPNNLLKLYQEAQDAWFEKQDKWCEEHPGEEAPNDYYSWIKIYMDNNEDRLATSREEFEDDVIEDDFMNDECEI